MLKWQSVLTGAKNKLVQWFHGSVRSVAAHRLPGSWTHLRRARSVPCGMEQGWSQKVPWGRGVFVKRPWQQEELWKKNPGWGLLAASVWHRVMSLQIYCCSLSFYLFNIIDPSQMRWPMCKWTIWIIIIAFFPSHSLCESMQYFHEDKAASGLCVDIRLYTQPYLSQQNPPDLI